MRGPRSTPHAFGGAFDDDDLDPLADDADDDDDIDVDEGDDIDADDDGADDDEADDDLDDEFPLGDGAADGAAVAHCPYCGEPVEILLDAGGGDRQEYVEDCEVCCRPWRVRVRYDRDGGAQVELRAMDE